MRIGTVIGRITLSEAVPSLKGGRWLLVSPFTKNDFQKGLVERKGVTGEPTIVVYDNIGAAPGDVIGMEEGAEASVPFKQPTPIDAINVALIDHIDYQPSKA